MTPSANRLQPREGKCERDRRLATSHSA